jgi:hypothetical protein
LLVRIAVATARRYRVSTRFCSSVAPPVAPVLTLAARPAHRTRIVASR